MKLIGIGVVSYLVVAATVLNGCAGPLRVDPLKNATAPPVVDEHLDLARRYAPWIWKAMDPDKGRQDVPAPVDFDGDLNGENNWEHFPEYELIPTVYYSALETETHWFLAYHLFHPRDWTPIDFGVHLTHENDGENLQVVVEKASGRVVLLFTQAHFEGGVYSNGVFGPGEREIRGPFLLVDDTGRPAPDARHVCVFVEGHGHGIYGVLDPVALVERWGDGSLVLRTPGRVFRPALPGEAIAEPEPVGEQPVPYRLESLAAKLWPLLRSGELVGEGRLLDGAVPYEDARVRIGVPRYYEADRWSGPFGPDRGMSPFALDFTFDAPFLGALYFDPAGRYAATLEVPEPWSTEYVSYPFQAP